MQKTAALSSYIGIKNGSLAPSGGSNNAPILRESKDEAINSENNKKCNTHLIAPQASGKQSRHCLNVPAKKELSEAITQIKSNEGSRNSSDNNTQNKEAMNCMVGEKESSMEELSDHKASFTGGIDQQRYSGKFGDLEGARLGEEVKVHANTVWSDPEEDLDYLGSAVKSSSDGEVNIQLSIKEESDNMSREKKSLVQPKINIIPDPLDDEDDSPEVHYVASSGLSKSFDGSNAFGQVDLNKLLEVPRPVEFLKPSGDLSYVIKDTATGRSYDIRDNQSVVSLNEAEGSLTTLSDGDPWEGWWKKKRANKRKFFSAAEKNDVSAIEDLLNSIKYGELAVDIDEKGLSDFTALHCAASEGHMAMAEYLVSKGANVNALSSELKTPLHLACNRGVLKIIQCLVEAGANINAQDIDRITPAHILSSVGHAEALNWFLTKQPDLSLKNSYGETPAETAASLEIRQIFTKSAKLFVNKNYSRTVMRELLLHNNRADVIKGIMFQTQLISTQVISRTPSPRPRAMDAKSSFKSPARRVRILELAEKLKSMPLEEEKEVGANAHIRPLTCISPREKGKKPVTTNDFEAITLLGQGSFGVVYLVRYKGNNQLYAMKMLNKRMLMSQNMIKYTRTERDVLSISKHPFIVGLHFALQNAEKLFMVMEYCPGYG
eukprot:TRINITY_DN1130_c0_g3_i2.p1 TRINITY_DN1130_c0_g3~~TRINITY_DN1130_c0_g3_i2.p1  ORF type:complete len:663 (-),score=109.63 TRINITY_DN1130_c0_g3_i2:807-2795(-)